MLCGAVAGVGDLVGLDDQPEGVAADEDEDDAHQDEGGLLPAFPEVLAGGGVVHVVVAVAAEAVVGLQDGGLGGRA